MDEDIKHIRETLDKVLVTLEKPENKYHKLFEMVALVVTISGIVSVIDILRNWIGG